jgi:DeoR family transcriptional regulator, glycerol-3-phosphate regulon repressor
MLRDERFTEIMRVLESSGGTAAVAPLAAQLGVSEETIRRDIRRLAAAGRVRKLHGGVTLADAVEEAAFDQRLALNADAKRAIAHRVAEMVKDGESLMLDTGSTTAYVAGALREHRELSVVTSSVPIARELAMRNHNHVHMAGGELRLDDGASVGQDAIEFFDRFWVETAILAVGAIDLKSGLLEYTQSEAELSRALARNAKTRVLAADSSKFGRQAPVRDLDLSEIDILVTEATPPEQFMQQLEEAEVRVVLAGGSAA